MDLQIVPAAIEDRTVLRNLMNLYLYDFSEFNGEEANGQGLFEYGILDRYWSEPERHAFLVKAAGKYAGFVLVRDIHEDGSLIHVIAEFFVMRKYRRKKVGQQVAYAMFNRFPGKWRVQELETNHAAQHFWRKIIAEYTQGQYDEVRVPQWPGPMQVFQTPTQEDV